MRLGLVSLAFLLAVAPQEERALVELDAAELAEGVLAEWPNRGSLGGAFKTVGEARPAVGIVSGRRAVSFAGRDALRSTIVSPALKEFFTVEAWAFNPAAGSPETLVAWASRPDGHADFRYGATLMEAFSGTGAPKGGVRGKLPALGAWRHFAWVYGNGKLRLFIDGLAMAEKECALRARAGEPFTLGAGWDGKKNEPVAPLSGAISRLRIYARALSPREVRNSAGLFQAFSPSPADGAVVEEESAMLRWERGDAGDKPCEVRFGDDRSAMKPIAGPGPLQLVPGRTYYWRVDAGDVWSFSVSAGPAREPWPRNRFAGVKRNTRELRWTPGKYAVSQNVYFGTDAGQVRKGPSGLARETGRCAIPVDRLEPGTTYYWRVESENGERPSAPGEVWNFRTEDALNRNDITFFVASDPHFGLSPETDAVNLATIDEMHALPGIRFPASVGAALVQTPRGVLITGDLVEEGNARDGDAQWALFEKAYGSYCQYPVFEGVGNHDGNIDRSPRLGLKARNSRRAGIRKVSSNGLHYSWDWDDVHFVCMNLYVGSKPSPPQAKRGSWTDPQESLEFLVEDLAENVGRPIVIYHHYGFDGYSNGWYAEEEREAYFAAIKACNVLAIFYGHTHGVGAMKWNGIDAYNAPAAQPTPGRFLAVRIMPTEMVVAERKGGEWGMSWKKSIALPLLKPGGDK